MVIKSLQFLREPNTTLYMEISIPSYGSFVEKQALFQSNPRREEGSGGTHLQTGWEHTDTVSIWQRLSQKSQQFLLILQHLLSFLFRLKLKSSLEDAHDVFVIQTHSHFRKEDTWGLLSGGSD